MNKNRMVFTRILFIVTLILYQGCSALDWVQQKDREVTTQATDEAIKRSTALQELDKICTNIDLPAEFKFLGKGGLDDQKLSLAYNYYSDLQFEEGRKIFEHYFIKEGWIETDLSQRYPKQLDFANKDYRIAINYRDKFRSSNYTMYCEKLSQ